MKRDDIGARVGKITYVANWVVYHEMNVEQQLRMGAKSADNGHTERNVRHEYSVHNVKVQHITAGGFDFCDFFF